MDRRGLAGLSGLIIWGMGMGVGVAQPPSRFPVVESAALGLNMSVPWSQPVQVNDPFEGTFLAVFDLNYFPSRLLDARRVDVVSLWSRRSIRVLLAARNRDCIIGNSYDSLWGHACVELGTAKRVNQLLMKLGDRVFRVNAEDGAFPVSDELATALQAAPEGSVIIRLITERGETVDSTIGKNTVRAWKTVYVAS